MKKILLLLSACCFFATIIKSQPPLCEGKPAGSVWSAKCCKCKTNCVLIDEKPRMPGDCRHCQLLCVECRAEMGDLNKALEDLKQKNRDLNKEYQKKNTELQFWNKKFYEDGIKMFGRESGDGVYLDGLNGTFGTFIVASTSLLSNFTPGVGTTFKVVNRKWFTLGLTIATNGIGIYQTATGPGGDYSTAPGVIDGVTNYGGTISDLITLEYLTWLGNKIIDQAKLIRDINSGKSAPAIYSLPVYNTPTIPRLSEAQIKGLEKFNLFADIWAMGRAVQALIDGLADIGIDWENTSRIEKELQKIEDEILKNNAMMACIKETQDFINKGGADHGSAGNYFFGGVALYFMGPATISPSVYSQTPVPKNDFSNIKIRVNEINLKSAIEKLKQIKSMKDDMVRTVDKTILPYFLPWTTNRTNEIKPGIIIQWLKKTKPGFQELIKKCEQMNLLVLSIKDDIRQAIIFEKQIDDGSGNTGNSPLSEYTDESFVLTGWKPDTSHAEPEQWLLASNKKIPAGKGRLNLKFPTNVDWSVDIYTAENKFFTNRSSYSKHGSYDLAPGNYNFKLNSIPVDNVFVETGKETRLKVGIFNVVTKGHWELYDESKKTYFTSRNKPVKLVLPVGTYVFTFEKKDYTIKIKNGVILKFESRKPFFVDQ